jgi:hypothetical protein
MPARCPNGTRRNKKTGLCEQVGSSKNTSRKSASPSQSAETKCLEELAKLQKVIELKDKKIESLNEMYAVLKIKYDNSNSTKNTDVESKKGQLKNGTILSRVLDFYFEEMPKGRLPKNADEKAAKLKELRKIVDKGKNKIVRSIEDILSAVPTGLSSAAESTELGQILLDDESENERQFEFIIKYLKGIPRKVSPKKIWDGDKLTDEDTIYFRDSADYERITKVFYYCLTPAERSAAGIDNWEDCW